MGDSTEAASPPAIDRLDSWKEIAAYLKRNERTARRWEKTEGLPVYRHTHAKRDSVYAYKKQLDSWWSSRRVGLAEEQLAASVWNNDGWRTRLRWIGAIVGVMAIATLAIWYSSRIGPAGSAQDRPPHQLPRVRTLLELFTRWHPGGVLMEFRKPRQL